MTGWLLNLNKGERRTVIEQAAIRCGVVSQAIEKDWWVTLTLKAIFQTAFAPQLLFKGGTSLSKCWKLIERFSEDIDLAVDRDFLNFGGELTRNKIKKLKRKACNFTSTALKSAIEEQLKHLNIPSESFNIAVDEVLETQPDKDPQTLYLQYETLFEPVEYLPNVVKIEVSALSLKDPFGECSVQSMLHEYFPNEQYAEESFLVRAIEPRRTFLEKAFLLHEELARPDKLKMDRKSRHLSDLAGIMDTEHGHAALNDLDLYHTIVNHRKLFYALPGVDYATHAPGTINFLPEGEELSRFEGDYALMRSQMIYSPNALSFDDLIRQMKILQERFRNSPNKID